MDYMEYLGYGNCWEFSILLIDIYGVVLGYGFYLIGI